MAIITNFTGAALDQQLFLTDARLAESTRRQTELLADRAAANFGGLNPANFFVPLGAALPDTSGLFGGLPGLTGGASFPAPAPFGGATPFGAAFPAPAPFGLNSPLFPAPAPFGTNTPLFPAPAPFAVQDFSAQMLGSFGQLSTNWQALLGGALAPGPGFAAAPGCA